MESAVSYFRRLRAADRLLSRFAPESDRRTSRYSGLSGPAALPPCLPEDEHKFSSQPPNYLSSEQVGYIIANQYFNRPKSYSVRSMADRWAASTLYELRKVPAWLVTPYRRIKPGAKSKSTGPIIVDLKKDDFDHRYGSFGQNMGVVVLDGKHRLQEHKQEFGDGDIEAYVGTEAVPIINDYLRDFGPKRQAFVEALDRYYGDPSSDHWHELIAAGRAVRLSSGQLRHLWHAFRDGYQFSPVWGEFIREDRR